MGEPAGTSPEKIIKTVKALSASPEVSVVVTGDVKVFRETAKQLSLPLPFTCYVGNEEELARAEEEGEQYIFYKTSALDVSGFEPGRPTGETGEASFKALEAAVSVAQNGLAVSLVTSPVSAAALEAAGYAERDVDSLLERFADSDMLVPMVAAGKLKLFGLSKRISVKEARHMVTRENLLECLIKIDSLKSSPYFDSSKPLAVVSLNPQDADGRWQGTEEEAEMKPAIELARKLGIKVEGPLPAELAYARAAEGGYWAVLSMQASEIFSAAAVAAPGEILVITWGLPFLRVGALEDAELPLAGTGRTSIRGMLKAVATGLLFRESDFLA